MNIQILSKLAKWISYGIGSRPDSVRYYIWLYLSHYLRRDTTHTYCFHSHPQQTLERIYLCRA